MPTRAYNPRQKLAATGEAALEPRDLDSRDLQDVTDDLRGESEGTRDRVATLGSFPVTAYCRAALEAGVVTTATQSGARIVAVAMGVDVSLAPATSSDASYVVADQRPEPVHYFAARVTSSRVAVTAFDFGGVQVDLSAGSHAFVLMVHDRLSQEF